MRRGLDELGTTSDKLCWLRSGLESGRAWPINGQSFANPEHPNAQTAAGALRLTVPAGTSCAMRAI